MNDMTTIQPPAPTPSTSTPNVLVVIEGGCCMGVLADQRINVCVKDFDQFEVDLQEAVDFVAHGEFGPTDDGDIRPLAILLEERVKDVKTDPNLAPTPLPPLQDPQEPLPPLELLDMITTALKECGDARIKSVTMDNDHKSGEMIVVTHNHSVMTISTSDISLKDDTQD
jgi:hypothetical protein